MNIEAAATANQNGLELFAAADPDKATDFLKKAYRHWADEKGILVNLGLALMQQGYPDKAAHCYKLAISSTELRTRRSARKNLGFLHLWRGEWQTGWHLHGKRFESEKFLASQWQGEPLNKHPLVVWNDVGMGDAFHFVRYTLPLIDRGEKIIFAVHKSQVSIFSKYLAWPLYKVVDRETIDLEACIHIPLMSLIPLLDNSTEWGRKWDKRTWKQISPSSSQGQIGICWASNPGDPSMHNYKSSSPGELLDVFKIDRAATEIISLQTDEPEVHKRMGLLQPKLCWLETLKQISNCKLILSVDTAVAHLAAGANKPVKMLLPKIPDWRWQQALGARPCWYPNLTLKQRP